MQKKQKYILVLITLIIFLIIIIKTQTPEKVTVIGYNYNGVLQDYESEILRGDTIFYNNSIPYVYIASNNQLSNREVERLFKVPNYIKVSVQDKITKKNINIYKVLIHTSKDTRKECIKLNKKSDFYFYIEKVEKLKLIKTQVIKPDTRYLNSISLDEQLYLPSSSVIRFIFNKTIDKQSVTEFVANHFLTKPFRVSCTFINEKTFELEFILKKNLQSELIELSLNKIKDIHKLKINESKKIRFTLVQGRYINKYIIDNNIIYSISDQQHIIANCYSSDHSFLVVLDLVSVSFNDIISKNIYKVKIKSYNLLEEKLILSKELFIDSLDSVLLKCSNNYIYFNNSIYDHTGKVIKKLSKKVKDIAFSNKNIALVESIGDKQRLSVLNDKFSVISEVPLNSNPIEIKLTDTDLLILSESGLYRFDIANKKLKYVRNYSLDYKYTNTISPSLKYIITQVNNKVIIKSVNDNSVLKSLGNSSNIKSIFWSSDGENIIYYQGSYIIKDKIQSKEPFIIAENIKVSKYLSENILIIE